jgi:hypothetical protein
MFIIPEYSQNKWRRSLAKTVDSAIAIMAVVQEKALCRKGLDYCVFLFVLVQLYTVWSSSTIFYLAICCLFYMQSDAIPLNFLA